MSQFIRYPAVSGGSSGSSTGVPYVVGPLDGAAASANGATIGSNTLYMQTSTATLPGLVSSNSQTFAGVKTFSSAPILGSLATGINLKTDGSGIISGGSVSLTTEVSGILPRANGGSGTSGGSFTTGSVTITSSAGGNAYTITLPGTLSLGSTSILTNDGAGNLAWTGPFVVGSGNGASNTAIAKFVNPGNVLVGTGVLISAGNGVTGAASYSGGNYSATNTGTLSAPAFGLVDTGSGLYRPSLQVVGITASAIQIATFGTVGLTVVGSVTSTVLTASAPILTDGGKYLTSGSISLTTHVTGNLPLSQTSGSISLTNQVSGSLPLSQTSGSISLVNQVVGNLPLSQTSGSISLTNQVSGQIDLAVNVSGILPRLNGGTGKADGNIVVGSITMSQTATGATYAAAWPAAQGGAATFLRNDGSGNLTWVASISNPTPSLTIGSLTLQQVAGGATYTVSLPSVQGSSSASILTNDGTGTLTWAYNVDVGCRAISASKSPVGSSVGTVTFVTSIYDTHSAFSTTTGLFTAPAAGKYQVNAGLLIKFSSSASDNVCGIVIKKNGVDYSQVSQDTAVLETQQNCWISDVVICSQGHTIGIAAFGTQTSPTVGSSSLQNFLSIQKVSN